MYQKNAEEYCGEVGVEEPIILDTLCEIVEKFLKYFDYFLKEKQKLQKEVEIKIKEELKEIIKNYKTQDNKGLALEVANTLNEALKETESICQVSPLQEINIIRLDFFLKEFEEKIRNICESYATFLENKNRIVNLLEKNIKSISPDSLDNELLEEIYALQQVQDKTTFELRIHTIIEKIEKLSIEGKVDPVRILKIEKREE